MLAVEVILMDNRNNRQDDTDMRDEDLRDRTRQTQTQQRSRAETGEISEDEDLDETRSDLGAGE